MRRHPPFGRLVEFERDPLGEDRSGDALRDQLRVIAQRSDRRLPVGIGVNLSPHVHVGPNQVAIVVATMIAVLIARRRGHTLESLGKAAAEELASKVLL